ncbi:unnamed protein product [Caenorhabditis sp. 36 PRJEB53466]|nr:unnamed protein product [Caenorhabditis sp. 36 PRJEB53466]
MIRLILTVILLLVAPTIYGFLEETEGVEPRPRTCDPDEERAAQSCKNGLTVLSATFASIQGQHESFTASDHIGINRNCKTALSCLKSYVGCSDISQDDVDSLQKKCDYMIYLTGGFYACSQKLKERLSDSECVKNFFDDPETVGTGKDDICGAWSANRACLKWTIRDACSRSYWKQYKPFWHLRYSLLKCI